MLEISSLIQSGIRIKEDLSTNANIELTRLLYRALLCRLGVDHSADSSSLLFFHTYYMFSTNLCVCDIVIPLFAIPCIKICDSQCHIGISNGKPTSDDQN